MSSVFRLPEGQVARMQPAEKQRLFQQISIDGRDQAWDVDLVARSMDADVGPVGQPCGTILWESKRTKNWSDGWLTKLRGDQRAAKAEIALIDSEALPKGVATFDLIDGIWVAHPRFAIPVAVVLRQSLIELAASRVSQEGQATKMEMVYQYLTGPRFRHRVEAIVEKFSDIQDDLNKEKKATTRLWANRES